MQLKVVRNHNGNFSYFLGDKIISSRTYFYLRGGATNVSERKTDGEAGSEEDDGEDEDKIKSTKLIGPKTFVYYDINGKKIILCGEIHRAPETKDEDKLQMEEFIDYIANETEIEKKCFDFFVEGPPTTEESWHGPVEMLDKQKIKQKEYPVLQTLRSVYADNLKKKDHIRVHKIDIRVGDPSDKNVYEQVLSTRNEYKHDKLFGQLDKSVYRQVVEYLLLVDKKPSITVQKLISDLCYHETTKKVFGGGRIDYPENFSPECKFIVNRHIYIQKELIDHCGSDNLDKGDDDEIEYLKYLKKIKYIVDQINTPIPKLSEVALQDAIQNQINFKFTNSDIDSDIKIKLEGFIYNIITQKPEEIPNYLYKCLEREIIFYKQLDLRFEKLKKTYAKFERIKHMPDLQQIMVNILCSNEYIEQYYSNFDLNDDIGQGLASCQMDFYTVLRMFITFNKKDRDNATHCNNVLTPTKILLYAGDAHTSLYNQVLKHYFAEYIKLEINPFFIKSQIDRVKHKFDLLSEIIETIKTKNNEEFQTLAKEYVEIYERHSPSKNWSQEEFGIIFEHVQQVNHKNIKILAHNKKLKEVTRHSKFEVDLSYETTNKENFKNFDEVISDFVK